jgi:hypothetical protein
MYFFYLDFNNLSGHIDFIFPIVPVEGEGEADLEKKKNQRWTTLLQKTLNPKCRQLRLKNC